MNLIILAAGSGKRLYPLTKNKPKSLLDIGDGTTLLDRQLQKAVDSNCITRIYIVVGYLQEQIEAAIRPYQEKIPIELIYNPYYDVSNALLSLWCAHYVMEQDDFFISNGDNIYKTNIFDEMYDASGNDIKLAISHKDTYDADDMKIEFSNAKTVVKVSKDIPMGKAEADSVGLLLVRGEPQRQCFHRALLDAAKDKNYFNAFWQQVFDYVVSAGQEIGCFEVAHSDWAEIDFHPDVELMKKALFGKLP